MNKSTYECLDYLIPPKNYFWRWEEDGEVAVWKDGSTLAYRAEIEAVIKHIAPYGLPSLGALLIALAATRKSWNSDRIRGLFEQSLECIPVFGHYTLVLTNVFKNLDRINNQISDDLRTENLCASLCELIFRNDSPHIDFHVSKSVIEGINSGISGAELHEIEPALKLEDAVIKDLETLESCLNSFNSSNIFNSIHTGVSATPQNLELESKQNEKISLQGLLADDRLRGLGLLVQRILAVMNLPRPVSDTDHLPLGGVSDITNRGDLDKLLLSELANDDLTLAVRIASNEALYIRREAPPGKPPVNKTVFLDQGIRYWGAARIYALAIAVSLNMKKDLENLIFTSHINRQFKEISLETKEEILEMMEILESPLSPTEALRRWFFNNEIGDTECLFIFHEKQMKDTKLVKFINELNLTVYSLFLINDQGHFKIIRVTDSERKIIVEAQLKLEDLFEEKKVAEEIIEPVRANGLPKFYDFIRCPLLIPFWDKPKRLPFDYSRDAVFDLNGNPYVVTRANFLLEFAIGTTKGQYINLPFNENIAYLHYYDGKVYILLKNDGQDIFVTDSNFRTPPTKTPCKVEFASFAFHEDKLIQLKGKIAVATSLIDGREESVEKTLFESSYKRMMEEVKAPKRSGTKMHRFQSVVFKKKDNAIYLQSSHGSYVCVNQKYNFRSLFKCNVPFGKDSVSASFKPVKNHGSGNFYLYEAKLVDGSSVFLDSRGFLHLVSATDSIPEISLVLNRDDIAVWTSNGHFEGNPEFHATGEIGSNATVYIYQFINRLFQ